VERSERTDVYRPFVADQLSKAVLSEGAFKKVVLDPQYLNVAQPDEKILVMDAVITRLEAGNGPARLVFQLGATDFQIEGKLYDAKTGRTALEFVERSREIDRDPSNPTAKTLSADYTLKRTIRKVATSVSRLLKDLSAPGVTKTEVVAAAN
jgi:hypothetical protein